MMKRILATGSVFLFLSMVLSCVTPYQPENSLGGYSSEQIDENTFKVTFKGNQHTSVQKVRDYLIFRCAELTLENNYNYFMIMSDLSYRHDNAFDNQREQPWEVRESLTAGQIVTFVPDIETEPRSSDLVGTFIIQMSKEMLPQYPSAMINARAFIEEHRHMIKK